MITGYAGEFASNELFEYRRRSHTRATDIDGDVIRRALRDRSLLSRGAVLLAPSAAKLLDGISGGDSGSTLLDLGRRVDLYTCGEVIQRATGFPTHQHNGYVLELPPSQTPSVNLSTQKTRRQAVETLAAKYSPEQLQDFVQMLGEVASKSTVE